MAIASSFPDILRANLEVGQSAKVGDFFCAGDFSAGRKLLSIGELRFWLELPVR